MKFNKKLFFCVVLAAVVVTAIIFWISLSPNTRVAAPKRTLAAHFYKEPNTNIKDVRVKVFYVVPKNKSAAISKGWREILTASLLKASNFHELQFHGTSRLHYDLFPKPAVLRNDDIFYDTTSTNAGNPRGLVAIAQEIDRRVFRAGGDLYGADFIKFNEGEYPVMGLVYEGVGGSGGVIYDTNLGTVSEISKRFGIPESIIYIVDVESVKGFFLLNRALITDAQYQAFGSTLFYHEFGHTIGLPDLSDDRDIPFSDGVMGSGRREPIETTYIERDLLEGLGVIGKN